MNTFRMSRRLLLLLFVATAAIPALVASSLLLESSTRSSCTANIPSSCSPCTTTSLVAFPIIIASNTSYVMKDCCIRDNAAQYLFVSFAASSHSGVFISLINVIACNVTGILFVSAAGSSSDWWDNVTVSAVQSVIGSSSSSVVKIGINDFQQVNVRTLSVTFQGCVISVDHVVSSCPSACLLCVNFEQIAQSSCGNVLDIQGSVVVASGVSLTLRECTITSADWRAPVTVGAFGFPTIERLQAVAAFDSSTFATLSNVVIEVSHSNILLNTSRSLGAFLIWHPQLSSIYGGSLAVRDTNVSLRSLSTSIVAFVGNTFNLDFVFSGVKIEVTSVQLSSLYYLKISASASQLTGGLMTASTVTQAMVAVDQATVTGFLTMAAGLTLTPFIMGLRNLILISIVNIEVSIVSLTNTTANFTLTDAPNAPLSPVYALIDAIAVKLEAVVNCSMKASNCNMTFLEVLQTVQDFATTEFVAFVLHPKSVVYSSFQIVDTTLAATFRSAKGTAVMDRLCGVLVSSFALLSLTGIAAGGIASGSANGTTTTIRRVALCTESAMLAALVVVGGHTTNGVLIVQSSAVVQVAPLTAPVLSQLVRFSSSLLLTTDMMPSIFSSSTISITDCSVVGSLKNGDSGDVVMVANSVTLQSVAVIYNLYSQINNVPISVTPPILVLQSNSRLEVNYVSLTIPSTTTTTVVNSYLPLFTNVSLESVTLFVTDLTVIDKRSAAASMSSTSTIAPVTLFDPFTALSCRSPTTCTVYFSCWIWRRLPIVPTTSYSILLREPKRCRSLTMTHYTAPLRRPPMTPTTQAPSVRASSGAVAWGMIVMSLAGNAVGGLSGGIGGLGSAGRLQVMALSSELRSHCNTDDEVEDASALGSSGSSSGGGGQPPATSSAVLDNPLQIHIDRFGSDIAYSGGAVIGNVLLIAGVGIVLWLLRILRSRISVMADSPPTTSRRGGSKMEKTWRALLQAVALRALSVGSFPGCLVLLYSVLVQPTITAAVVLVPGVSYEPHAPPTMSSRWLCVLIGLVGLLLTTVPLIWCAVMVLRSASFPLSTVVRHPQPSSSTSSRNKNIANVLVNVLAKILAPDEWWVVPKDTRKTTSSPSSPRGGVDVPIVPSYLDISPHELKECYGPLFECYRSGLQWFFLVELGWGGAVAGMVGGIALSLNPSSSSCSVGVDVCGWILILISVGQLALHVVLRPLTVLLDRTLAVTCASLAVASQVLNQLDVFGNVADALNIAVAAASFVQILLLIWQQLRSIVIETMTMMRSGGRGMDGGGGVAEFQQMNRGMLLSVPSRVGTTSPSVSTRGVLNKKKSIDGVNNDSMLSTELSNSSATEHHRFAEEEQQCSFEALCQLGPKAAFPVVIRMASAEGRRRR